MSIKGQVVEVFERDWAGRTGPIKLYSFKINGDNRFFRTGEESLVKQGDVVEFDADGKGNVSNLFVVDNQPVQQQRSAPPPRTGGGYKQKQAEKDAYWSDKEQRDIAREQRQQETVEPRITWSSAQSDAVAVVTAALQHDLLAFGNANKSAKLGLLLGFVDQVTARFAAQRWNAAKLLKQAVENSEFDEEVPYGDNNDNGSDLG